MQKGFATLELIFFVLIISILTAVAIPQAKNLVERATLDYEQKRLYSELKFLQTFGRSSSVGDLGMKGSFIGKNNSPMLLIDLLNGKYQIVGNEKVSRKANEKAVHEPHYLSNGVKISYAKANSLRIIFRPDGKIYFNGEEVTSERTLTFKPQNPKPEMTVPTIVFDSVGRIRGGRTQLP